MERERAILTAGLTKRFGQLTAVQGLELAVERGEIYGLIGPNGSGKTTTMRLLCGLLRPDSGEAYVLGQRSPRLPHPL